ncbi:DAK2 domain-containing protein [Thermovenabulum sp.]|uniref:DAK2 domain-containing protein n=1 Tax=Thermovenabulum sp. TaxID=3100335 RepID=UPI003C79F7E0
MQLEYIDAELFRRALYLASKNLSDNRKIVDSLNVYPVPDGDTGTNMSLTIEQAVEEMKKMPENDLKKLADAAAWGALMGARGNSGVILSQLFRGFAAAIGSDKKILKAKDLANSFQKGVEEAYKAILKPVEGTILTVAREMAQKMQVESSKNKDIIEVLEVTIEHGKKVLEKTPEMLKVLKEAGVVDAGGKGLIFLAEGFLKALKNTGDIKEELLPSIEKEKIDNKIQFEEVELTFLYCTEFIVESKNQIPIERLRNSLIELGDSLIVTGMDNLAKVHIHTNHPGKVLEEALRYGELRTVKIDNMKLQHQEYIAQKEQNTPEDTVKETLIISVASGEGIKEIFKTLGADIIIEGGQTMNPSTESILSIIENQNSNNVILLPNNKNIILTAEQVKKISEKKVYVIPTKSFPQGISALMAYNPEEDIESNIENMMKAFDNVVTGEITFAVRDSKWNGHEIKKGNILGMVDGELKVVGSNCKDVLLPLIFHMMEKKNGNLLTIYAGNDINEQEKNEIKDLIESNFPDLEVEIYEGGQNLYYYILSLE